MITRFYILQILLLVLLYHEIVIAQNRFDIKTFSVFSQTETTTLRTPSPQWKILGGGAHAELISHTQDGNMLTAMYPVDINTWYARAQMCCNGRPNVQTYLWAYATAIFDPYDELDVKIFSSPISVSGPYPNATIEIPLLSFYLLTGGGALVQPTAIGNYLTASYPESTEKWFVKSKDHIYVSPSRITAYAIGIKARNATAVSVATYYGKATSAIASHPSMSYTAKWGTVTGGGAKTTYFATGNILYASMPAFDQQNSTVAWRGEAKDITRADPSTISVCNFTFGKTYSLA